MVAGMTEAANLISIDTVIERPLIRIDGELHELVSPDELTVMQSVAIRKLGTRLDKLMNIDEPDDEAERKLSATLNRITDIIMRPVPAAVRAKLTEVQQLQVIEVFTMLLLAKKAQLAGAPMLQQFAGTILDAMKAALGDKQPSQPQSPGSATSPASSGSTAATSGTG